MKKSDAFLRDLRVKGFCGALVVVAGIACESTTVPVPLYEHTVSPEMVTGAALAALKPDGRFTITLPATAPGQLSIGEARTQTLQFARYVTNNLFLRSGVEGGRGGYWTDPHLLTLCTDAYFVNSQLGEIAHDSLGEPGLSYVKRLGDQWLIPMCGDKNEPQMTVYAAIDGNDIRFANGEPIEPYAFLTSAWNAGGVPLNWPDALSISAERAVRFAYETFGIRVSELPQLFVRGDALIGGGYAAQPGSARFCNRWRVVLESDVTIRGQTSLETKTTNVVYVAALSCSSFDVEPFVHLPLSDQPESTTLQYVDTSVSPSKTWHITIPFTSPVRFEIGTPQR
jgi:hypothetical protein